MTSKISSLVSVLQTMAYHVSCIMTDNPKRTDEPFKNRTRFGLGLCASSEKGPGVHVDVVICPDSSDDPWGPWAQVYMRESVAGFLDSEPNIQDGTWTHCGNRSGGRDEYVKRCAPVVAWAAAQDS